MLTRVRLLCRFKSVPCPLIIVSCNLESSSYWRKGGDSLTNGDYHYKCKFHIQKRNFYCFSELLLYLLLLKNNQLKIIFIPKMHILGWHILLPFNPILFLYFWDVLKNIKEKKQKQKHCSWQRSTELLIGKKHLFLALWPVSGGLWQERKHQDRMPSGN